MLIASTFATANALSYEKAQWLGGRFLVSTGIPSNRVEAGFDWVAYHEGYISLDCSNFDRRGYVPDDACFPGLPFEGYVFNTPQTQDITLNLVKTIDYKEYGFFGKSTLYVYERRVFP